MIFDRDFGAVAWTKKSYMLKGKKKLAIFVRLYLLSKLNCMSFSEKCCRVFEQATNAYHITNHIDATVHNLYEVKSIQKPGVNI